MPSRSTGHITKVLTGKEENAKDEVEVQCFPFFSFMAALEVETVDFLSLDVEGLELSILKTIPFSRLRIRVMAVEVVNSPKVATELKAFLEPHGFRTLGSFYHEQKPFDLIFVHESVQVGHGALDLLDKPKPRNLGWQKIVDAQAAADRASREN